MRHAPLASGIRFYLSVVVACGVLLAGIELVLRWVFPDRVASTADYETIEADETLGYRLKSSITASFRRTRANGGDRITWHTNSRGYRGDELGADGTPRVIVYGDSNVQAVFSRDENTFPERLERRVAETLGRPIEMINAGVIGYGPDQHLLRMAAELPSLQPSLVILTVFADNDLGDPLRHRLLELRDGRLERRSDHFIYRPPTSLEHARLVARSLLITRATVRMLSAVRPEQEDVQANGAEARVRVLEELTAREFEHYITPGSAFVRGDHYDIDVAVDPERESSRTKLALFRAIIAEARRATERANVPLLVVVQPSRVDLTTADSFNHEVLSKAYASYDRTRLTSLIADVCREEMVDVIDLYDVFSRNEPATLYFADDDSHWNDAGQALAAELVTPRVAQHLRDVPRRP
jgi:lysophospholipase L1-like esterase